MYSLLLAHEIYSCKFFDVFIQRSPLAKGEAGLNGDLPQWERERVLNEFRAGNFRFLVATDVASRGIDVPDISCDLSRFYLFVRK